MTSKWKALHLDLYFTHFQQRSEWPSHVHALKLHFTQTRSGTGSAHGGGEGEPWEWGR